MVERTKEELSKLEYSIQRAVKRTEGTTGGDFARGYYAGALAVLKFVRGEEEDNTWFQRVLKYYPGVPSSAKVIQDVSQAPLSGPHEVDFKNK